MQGRGPREFLFWKFPSLEETALPKVVVGGDSGGPELVGSGEEGPRGGLQGPLEKTSCLLDSQLPSAHPFSLRFFLASCIFSRPWCRLSVAPDLHPPPTRPPF